MIYMKSHFWKKHKTIFAYKDGKETKCSGFSQFSDDYGLASLKKKKKKLKKKKI